MKLFTFTDGGSRNNPGPAALGVVIKNENGDTVAAYGEYLGEQTNNYAEYMGLISALEKAVELGATEVEAVCDSKLVVEQLNGNWKVKEPSIQRLVLKAMKVMRQLKKVTIKHVLRDQNKAADEQVNIALDKALS